MQELRLKVNSISVLLFWRSPWVPERKRDSDTQLRTENSDFWPPMHYKKGQADRRCFVKWAAPFLPICRTVPLAGASGLGGPFLSGPLLTFTVALSGRKVRAGLQNPGSIRRPGAQLFLLYLSWWTCCSWCFSGQWWESDKNLLLLQIFPSLRPALLALTGEPGFGPEALSLSLCPSFHQGMPEVKWKTIYGSSTATL